MTRIKGYKMKLVDCPYCEGNGFIRSASNDSTGFVDKNCCKCAGSGARLKPCGYKTNKNQKEVIDT